MTGAGRVIVEVVQNAGDRPFVQHDSDALFTPAAYENIVGRTSTDLVIAADDVNVELAIPNVCLLAIVADVPIGLRVAGGETLMPGRNFYFGAKDETVSVLTARSLLLSGTGTAANVKVTYLATVT